MVILIPCSPKHSISKYLSVFSPNAGKIRTRITPNKDTFYAVKVLNKMVLVLTGRPVYMWLMSYG